MSGENGQYASWIPDGYTMELFVKAVPGLHGGVKGKYRPVVVMEQARIDAEMRQAPGDAEKHQWIAAKWISLKVVSWDIKKPDGSLVDHKNIEDVLHVAAPLFTRLWGIINGSDPNDVDTSVGTYELYSLSKREMAISAASTGEKSQTPEEVDSGN